jgi:hypothetical protein
VQHVYVCINEVEEAPSNGGTLKEMVTLLKRDKPLILYVSSSKEDFKRVWDVLKHAQENPSEYEKKKLFGVGHEAISSLDAYVADRKTNRSKGLAPAESLDDSAFFNTNDDDAPALELQV